jgi:hypothetical protein
VANLHFGSDGKITEQSDDGAFYVTQEKADVSNEFEEIVSGCPEED